MWDIFLIKLKLKIKMKMVWDVFSGGLFGCMVNNYISIRLVFLGKIILWFIRFFY